MLSTQQQQRLIKVKNQYDVAVVGGGIYGAAAAWEAASRGLNVILIEADDFCSGTSANSLKTVHGGLRPWIRGETITWRRQMSWSLPVSRA